MTGTRSPIDLSRGWLVRWRPLLPIFLAEFIVLLGFGALLPVMPLYVRDQGMDAATLGIIIAGWPIAKLMFEPVFGWLADRGRRRPQMLAGLVLLAVATMLPVVFTSAAALFLLRFASGLGAAMYDPAARGTIVDATETDERGEAFGLYAAFQMGGFILGPVVGAVGASLGGGFGFPFILTGLLTLVAAVMLLVTFPSRQVAVVRRRGTSAPPDEAAGEDAAAGKDAAADGDAAAPTTARPPDAAQGSSPRPQAPPAALLNRVLVAALVVNFGFQLAFGTYEVVWSLFLTGLGASIEWVALTFVLFGLPAMIISPIAGRIVDRRGPIRFMAVGGLLVIVSGAIYALSWELILPSVVTPLEAVAESFFSPALFALVALGTPFGRSATVQGVFGAVGTAALVVASVAAGALWDVGPTMPFWFFVVGSSVCLGVGLFILRGVDFRRAMAPVAAKRTSVPGADPVGGA